MATFDIHEAKAHFAELIDRVTSGEEIIIAKGGNPVAKLVRYVEMTEPRRTGTLKRKIWMAPDWDSDETNEEIAKLFYGEEE